MDRYDVYFGQIFVPIQKLPRMERPMASTSNSDTPNLGTSPARLVLDQLDARIDAHEEPRQAILDMLLKSVPFDGWTALALDDAVIDAGYSANMGVLAFPDGIVDAIDLFTERSDIAMLRGMDTEEFADLKIREKVTQAIVLRLAHLEPNKECARRAAGTLALPPYASTGAKLIWRTADRIWRGLGDSSTDYNYYTKRATLTAVWSSVFTRWLADDSEDHQRTRDFLDDRIDNVMGIEKAKKQWRDLNIDPGKFLTETVIPSIAKMRYPSGR